MADSVEQLYKAQDLQDKLYPITKENAVKDNNNVSLDTKLTSINTSISNKLEAVKINNTALPITDKAVNITIDSAVSETSTNAVQNNVIKSYVDTTKEDISNGVLENLTSGSSLKLYAQETLADQEFLYRESPTEEDGLANIVGIKGQTLKWNQQSQSSRETYTAYGMTISCTDGLWSFQGTYTGENGSPFKCGNSFVSLPAGHKVLLLNTSPWKVRLQGNETATNENTPQNRILQTESGALADIVIHVYGLTSGDTVNAQYRFGIIDLTVMFGETKANEIYAMETAQIGSGVAYFKSLFPLDYYPYNSGSLIPFMGNGIKTVGKNLLPMPITSGSYANNVTITVNEDKSFYISKPTASGWTTFQLGTFYLPKGSYSLIEDSDGDTNQSLEVYNNITNALIVSTRYTKTRNFVLNEATQIRATFARSTIANNVLVKIMLFFSTSATSYEPYTESVINLPISTYFPSGMKDVPDYTNGGKIYDEMTSNRADTRVGNVDLGTLDWSLSIPSTHIFRGKLTDTNAKIPNASNLPNALLANYQPKAYNPISANDNGYFAIGYRSYDDVDVIVIIDSNYSTQDSFISHISGQYLYYELATPIETSFTTASLVTENGEMRYPVYAGGTEQILPENSSTPTTAPIIADIEYSYDFKAVDRIIGMLNSVAQNETSPSTHNYSVGDYLVYKYQLYKVIASISTGASLTVGTNIQATTIMNELASLS